MCHREEMVLNIMLIRVANKEIIAVLKCMELLRDLVHGILNKKLNHVAFISVIE